MQDVTIVVECRTCGQKNRVPLVLAPGKVARCGACKTVFADDDGDDDDLDGDDDAADTL